MPFHQHQGKLYRDPVYTQEENEYLRAHPGRAERAEVARHLGRTTGAVTQQLSKLGVIRQNDPDRPLSWSRGVGPRPQSDAERPPPPDPTERVGRPAWFADEGGESQREFARRLMGGR
jgi:hypothetical protein